MADLCPRCGAPDVEGDKCARCGVIASVYKASLEKMRRPPTLPAAAPTVDYSAAPPPSSPAATATAAWPLGGPSRGRKLTFHGSAGTLFGIHTVNILLTLVTLGFYRFWGKVKIRRYILSQTAFEGDRFGYHGTGKELLLGFVKALLFVGLPIAALSWAGQLTEDTLIQVGARLLTSSLVMVFIPIAIVGARRYRLSRTSWRGIRFSFRGRTRAFVKLFVRGWLLSGLTLSLYYPFFETNRHGFLVSHSYFGQRRLRFDGRGRDLFGSYLLALLLLLPTLGFYWFWFQAKKARYYWEHTAFETARFRSTVTGRLVMNLTLSNVLLLLVTLGFAWPWVLVRSMRFAFAYVTIDGPLDLDGIVQEPQAASATGDALSNFFGADVDLG